MGGEIKMVERSSRMVVESWPFSPFWSLAAPLPSLFNSVVCKCGTCPHPQEGNLNMRGVLQPY